MTTATQAKVTLLPFTVELGDERNRQINIPLLHEALRGRWEAANIRGRELGEGMAGMPDIPGLHLTIDFRKRKLTISDPLVTSPKLLEQVTLAMRKARKIGHDQKVYPVETREIEVDEHEIKTLGEFVVKSLLHPASGQPKARLVSGTEPTSEQLDELPGEYLYDPGSETQNGPKFRRDAQEWFDRVQRGL